MDDRLEQLLAQSFRTVPAIEANAAMERVREGHGGGDPDAPRAKSYELVLTTWDDFAAVALPRLVYHLESLGSHLPECHGVVIAAFAGDELRFVEAREVIAAAARLLQTTPQVLAQRHGTGESRTAQRGPPILLPPPPGTK